MPWKHSRDMVRSQMSKDFIRCYTDLCKLQTFKERFDYLKMDGVVGRETFGFDRMFNQQFYRSAEWKHIRNVVIARDLGCDLGVPGFDIMGHRVIIHHMNTITLDDLDRHSDQLLNPEYLITTTHKTHNALHYGTDPNMEFELVERKPNDTCPWKL